MSNVKVTDNTNKVINDVKVKANVFLRLMADEIVKISKPKTPKDTNRLRSDILKQVLGLKGKIKWQKNYAGFQETKQFKNYTTPGTGPHYAENAVHKAVKNTSTIARKAGLNA